MISQKQKLLSLLSDGDSHRTDDILKEVYGANHLGCSRISARIKELRDDGHEIKGWKDEVKKSLFWYQKKS